MPTDFLVSMLFSPLGLIALIVIAFFGTAVLAGFCGELMESFGVKRIFAGYLAAVAGVLAYAFWIAFREARDRIDAGILPEGSLSEVLPGWTIYIFTLDVFAAFLILAVFGVPLIMLSHRMRIASVATSCAVAVVLAACLHLPLFLDTLKYEWAQARPLETYLSSLWETIVPFVVVAAAYSLGARLPLLARCSLCRTTGGQHM